MEKEREVELNFDLVECNIILAALDVLIGMNVGTPPLDKMADAWSRQITHTDKVQKIILTITEALVIYDTFKMFYRKILTINAFLGIIHKYDLQLWESTTEAELRDAAENFQLSELLKSAGI